MSKKRLDFTKIHFDGEGEKSRVNKIKKLKEREEGIMWAAGSTVVFIGAILIAMGI